MTHEGRDLYNLHRLWSSLIHPGIGLRRIDMVFDPEGTRGLAAETLRYAIAIAASSARVLDRGRP